MPRHLSHDVLGERPALTRDAEQHGRAEACDDLGEIPARRVGHAALGRERRRPRELALISVGDLTILGEQTAAIEHGDRRALLVSGRAVLVHDGCDTTRDTETAGTGAVDDDALLLERLTDFLERAHEPGGDDGTRALNVVVEGRQPVAIGVEDL